MTLPMSIPNSNFNMPFFFVPYLPNEKIFKYELKGISTIETILPNGSSSNHLYWLKQKICEIASQFYNHDTHWDSKS